MRTARIRLLLLSTIAIVLAGLLSPTAASAAPYCGITWGSLHKERTTHVERVYGLDNIRVARHACFDRLVIDIADARPLGEFSAGYGTQTVPWTNPEIRARGGAALHIGVGAAAFRRDGTPAYRPGNFAEAVDVSGFRTFRQVIWGGTGSNYRSMITIGTRARTPFRIFTLPGVPGSPTGTRLVVDVAHRW